MSGEASDELVVHLVNVPNFWKGRVNTRLLVSGMVSALAIVMAAAARAAYSGDGGFLGPMAFGGSLFGLLVLYAYLRVWNATVFVRDGRVGVTNWLGLRTEVPVESVDHLRCSAEVWTGETRPRGVLFIVTKDPRRSIRFGGGDRLAEGGLQQIAETLGTQIEGTWTDLPTWRPGTTS